MTTESLRAYKKMPLWTATTIPQLFLERHNTKAGTWGKLTILSGQLDYYELNQDGQVVKKRSLSREQPSLWVEPQIWHKVAPASDDLQFYVEFYCRAEDYFSKKYHIEPHSEVKEAVALDYIKPGKTLDLGCGQGRNTLYLASLGHQVTALDQNILGLEKIKEIAQEEHNDINTAIYDINTANLPGQESYDFILSTVVFMFLDPERIPSIIQNMQKRTKIGGYNLIVCAMDTAQAPCSMPFPFTFKEGELARYYADWDLVKYNENLGHLHRLDEFGNPIALQFATLLAKKVKE